MNETIIKKSKKILTVISIVSLSISITLLISAIFGVDLFKKGPLEYFFLSLVTICASSFFMIKSLTIALSRKIVSIITIILLIFSTIGGIIIYWTGMDKSITFNKIVGVLAIATVLFITIVSTYIKLDRLYLVLQIVTYCTTIIVDIILSLIICGVDVLENETVEKLFFALLLIAFALLGIINIIAVKSINNEKYIRIKEEEYKELLDRVTQLEKENLELKGEKK